MKTDLQLQQDVLEELKFEPSIREGVSDRALSPAQSFRSNPPVIPPILGNPTPGHAHHSVGHRRDGGVVRDHCRGRSELAVDAADGVQHQLSRLVVERSRRLVTAGRTCSAATGLMAANPRTRYHSAGGSRFESLYAESARRDSRSTP